MSESSNVFGQTYEQGVAMWRAFSEWSQEFAVGAVGALSAHGDNLAEQLDDLQVRYQQAISAAIVRRELAIAAGDVIAESIWRSAADETARVAFALNESANNTAERLLIFQQHINARLAAVGRFVGPAFDVVEVGNAIRTGDGNAAGEASLSLLLGLGAGAIVGAAALGGGFSVPYVLLAGGVGGVVASTSAEYLNVRWGRPAFDVLAQYLPDSWWQGLEGFAFGTGAARLDPSGSVYMAMLLHRIDSNVHPLPHPRTHRRPRNLPRRARVARRSRQLPPHHRRQRAAPAHHGWRGHGHDPRLDARALRHHAARPPGACARHAARADRGRPLPGGPRR